MPTSDTPTYDGLRTDQQRTFVDLVVVGTMSRSEAYRQAYAPRSNRVAGTNAARLLANARVARAVAERRAAVAKRTDASEARVVAGILAIATDPDARRGDVLRAWELLGKRLGLFVERVQVDVPTDTARARAAIADLGITPAQLAAWVDAQYASLPAAEVRELPRGTEDAREAG